MEVKERVRRHLDRGVAPGNRSERGRGPIEIAGSEVLLAGRLSAYSAREQATRCGASARMRSACRRRSTACPRRAGPRCQRGPA